MLEDAKRYAEKGTNFEILTQLQHFGGKTNLIDFSTDYLVALFFACDGSFDDDGRILLLKETEVIKKQYGVTTPRIPQNRVLAQKSKFVQPPEGIIDPSNEIDIPSSLKKPILDYLRKHHDISTETIYNDLHGFIINQNRHQSAYTEFFKGKTCHDNENYPKAIAHYTEALQRNPQLFEVCNNRGVAYGEIGMHDYAIKDFGKAIELESNNPTAYINRGLAYYHKGEYSHAIQDYNKALELKPDWADAQYNRGLAHYHNGEYEPAIRDFSIVIDSDANDSKAYDSRGTAYRKLGKHDYAIKDYSKAIELQSDYAKARYNRGLSHNDQARYDRAIQDFNKAIELKPDWADAHNNRGLAFYHKREYDLAAKDFNSAINIKLSHAAAYNNRGITHEKMGKRDCAFEDYDKTIELKPDWAPAYYNRGLMCLHMEDWEKAESDLTTAKNKGMDIVAAFRERYASISYLEKEIGVKLPEDIAAMLQPS